MVEQAVGAEESATSATDRIREVARETAHQARDQASRLVDQIKGHAEGLVNEKKAAAADQIDGLATALRKTVGELQEQEIAFAGYVERAASGLEGISGTIRDRDVGSIVGDVESAARRYPAAFLGLTVFAGFAFARFLKSSGERAAVRAPTGIENTSKRPARSAPPAPKTAQRARNGNGSETGAQPGRPA